jgi:hypothetical protein
MPIADQNCLSHSYAAFETGNTSSDLRRPRSAATLKITSEKLSPGCRIALRRSATPRGNIRRYRPWPSKLPSARHPIGKLFAIATKASAVMEMGIMVADALHQMYVKL